MRQYKKLVTFLLIAFIVSLGTLSTTSSAELSVQENALSFISTALPIDIAKYTSTLTQYGLTTPSAEGYPTTEIVEYTLESNGSKLVVSCSFSDKTFTGCLLIVKDGSIIPDKQMLVWLIQPEVSLNNTNHSPEMT